MTTRANTSAHPPQRDKTARFSDDSAALTRWPAIGNPRNSPITPSCVSTASGYADWRMAHEVAAAGYGYLWPQLVFSCDGERMNYWNIASAPDSDQPIRYLSNEHDSVGTAEFEQAVDAVPPTRPLTVLHQGQPAGQR